MNILCITYDGLTDFIGQSQVLPYLLGCAGGGHQLTVISFEKSERFAAIGSEVEAKCRQAGIEWRPQRFRSFPPYLAKFLDQQVLRRVATRLASGAHFDLVHCRSYPAAVAGLELKRRFGTRLLFDMRGFWPDSRREGGRWADNNPLGRYLYARWKAHEASLIRAADHIVALTQAAKDEIEQWPSYGGAPISVIPCCADFEIYRRADSKVREARRSELGFDAASPVLLYVGSLGTIYRLGDLLRLFDAIRRRDGASRLLIIGRGSSDEIAGTAAKLGMDLQPDEFRIMTAERSNIAQWISVGDGAACFYTPTFSSKHVSPTKLAEYLACGVPVIANRHVGDVERILTGLDGGHVLPDFSRESIEAGAEAFFRLRSIDREALRERARPSLDLPTAVAAYLAIYRDPTTAVSAASW